VAAALVRAPPPADVAVPARRALEEETMQKFDPVESMTAARHEFGEHGGVNMSIEASTTFTVMSADTMPSLFSGRKGPHEGCYLYGRHFNPTVYTLGRELAAMEGMEAGYCAASGMGAISSTVLQLCHRGDHAVASHTIYGGTFALLHDYLPPRTGIETTFVDVTDLAAVEAAFRDDTKMLYIESMSNPTLAVPDIPALAEIAHRHGAKLVVDNTFAPAIITPAIHGADVVVYSLTKYISGASDIIGGAICSSEEFLLKMMDVHDGSLMILGPTMDPNQAFALSLRLPHLPLRMKEHSRRGQIFAERLHDLGVPVTYPGLPDHPHHEMLERLRNEGYGSGSMIGIDLGTTERAYRFMNLLQNEQGFGYMAVSLGYFDTLMSCSASSTSSELSEEDQKAAGILPGYVRMSLGYTGSLDQRWDQLHTALKEVGMLEGVGA
jgi:methionine-gamma-lyase